MQTTIASGKQKGVANYIIMAAPEKVKLKFYHPRLWGLDPLFENKFKLNIIDVLQLIQYPNYKGLYSNL